VWLVRDATGEADPVPLGGRAMEVLDMSGGERSIESGMQHLSLFSSATTRSPHADQVSPDRSFGVVGLCALVVQSAREFACRGF
jgi:hypothetical protein